MAVQHGLCWTWSDILKTGFLTTLILGCFSIGCPNIYVFHNTNFENVYVGDSLFIYICNIMIGIHVFMCSNAVMKWCARIHCQIYFQFSLSCAIFLLYPSENLESCITCSESETFHGCEIGN